MREPLKRHPKNHSIGQGGPASLLFAIAITALLIIMPLLGEVANDNAGDNLVLESKITEDQQPLPRLGGSTRSQPEYYDLISYDDVLVVRNLNSPLSMQIADYFIVKRNIPQINICNITTSTSETVSRTVFENEIRIPVEDHIIDNGLIGIINYIVTTKGLPLRIAEEDTSDDASYMWDRACVDSDLALIIGAYQGYIGQPLWYNNPYFDPDPKEEFSMWNYSFFLVTRFTGYDWDDIKPLIDKPEIAIGRQGTFVLDVDPGRDGGGYQVGNDWMRDANTTLTANGFDVYLDETTTFLTNQDNASGYTSWGSNDGNYPKNSLVNTGLENDGNGDGVPDSWYFKNEGAIGFCERNDTEIRGGAWSVKIERNATSENATFFAQNYTVKPDTRYYAMGYVNLSGVSSEQGVHLQFRGFDAQGNVIQYYNGSSRTGTTANWVSLYQKHFEPIPGVTNISIGVSLSKSSGTVFVDDIYLYEIKPHNKWIPGTVVETYVSTGGRSFNYPSAYGQSLVADLIRDGVTGTKGYVYEPFLDACAHPDILFDAYTQGFNLAESYYMASAMVSWMDVVVGDPKVAPYRKDIIPDLSIVDQDIILSTNTPITGETIDITAIIENLGPTSTTDVIVAFYLEDPVNGSVLIGTKIIDVEGAGSNATSFTWDTTGYWGDFNITVVVDTQDRYFEANESNNNATKSMIVHNGFPVADAGLDASVDEDSLFVFDGSDSTSNSSIENYTWDFNDGTFGNGVSPSHIYISQGIYTVTLNITNTFGLWDTDTVDITVNNVPPTAKAGSDMIDYEGTSLELNASLSTDTPSDTGSLNYTWLLGDGNTSYGRTVTHTYVDDGIYVATLEVRDDDGAVGTDIVNITVDNVPPSITPVSDQITPEDAQFLLQVIADDVPADTLTFADNTTLFDIDAVTGEITFTPINSDVGIYLINITVTDDDGGLDFTVFQLTIINTNDPPHITSSPVTTATESTQYEYSVIVEDDDLLVDPFETITYSLDSAPAGMSINSSSGIISWVPAHDQAGLTLEVIVEVTDGELIDTQSFNVTVTNLNDEPVITSTPITEAVEDESYTYDVDATDVDTGDVLTYSLDQAPPGMNIDSLSGVISWEPENEHVGDHQVVVRVTDMDGKYDRQTFTLTVENVNDPPTLQPIDELTITEDMAFQYQVVVTDVDLYDELTYYDDSNLFDIDSETGIISFIPENDDVGTYIILISVSDLQGDTDDEVFTLNIENANDPPVLDFITGMIAFEDEFFSFTATASDVDVGDSCTFSDNTTLFNIEPNSGEVSFTPTNADVGIHVINISVFDQYGYFDYQEIVIIVENVNDPPVIPDTVKNDLSRDIEMTVGDSFTYTIIVDDVDADDEVTFSDDTDLFDINPTTGEIAFAPTSEDAGTHTVTITVTDSEGKEDHITLTFSIADEKEEEDRDTTMMTILLVIPIVVVVILLVLLLSKKKKQGGPPVAEPVEFIEFELQNEPSEEQAGQVFAPMVPLEHDTLPPPPGFPPQQ
jgi:uncharacterized protein (TIGR03790 family)